MSYQYFNIVNKKSLLLNGPKKGEAYTCNSFSVRAQNTLKENPNKKVMDLFIGSGSLYDEIKMRKLETIIWDKESKLECWDFISIAKQMGYQYIIDVQSHDGSYQSVWACVKEDVSTSFLKFSDKCYFGRIQPIHLVTL